MPANPEYKIKRVSGNIDTVPLFDVIDAADVWTAKGGAKIISLVGLQKIADKENIVEKKFDMAINPSKGNYQQHGVNIWLGFADDTNTDRWVRGSGEASKLNTGKYSMKANKKTGVDELHYDEIGQIDSSYRLAMAEKRAYSRALIKMIRLFGYYSDQEAAAFANPNLQNSNFGTGDF